MNKIKILIVEDEYLIARDTQLTLEDMGFDAPGIAMTGEEAIKMTEELNPNLIIMDIVLPGDMDGIEAAEEIQRRYNLPVIFLSGNLEGINMKRVDKMQHFGCLSKPCDDYTLRKTIEYAISSISTA